MIYLDYAADAPVEPEALARFCEMTSTPDRLRFGNPNAAHAAGRAARAEMARIAESIAALLGAQPDEVIFTSGATEANNTAVKGIACIRGGGRIISTPLEHASVRACLNELGTHGWRVDLLRLRPDGQIDLRHLAELLTPDTALLTVSAVDSELGAVQPLSEIQALLRAYPNCRLHVDATQAVGRIPISFDGIDTMSLSFHKFGGLNGSGLLLKRRNIEMAPLLHGGAGTSAHRSGTPALALAAAGETALRLALEHRATRFEAVAALNRRLRAALLARPGVRLNSPEAAVPHILNLSVAGIRGVRFQQALDKMSVCVSVKSACATDGAPSEAVLALCGDRRNALSSWRVSLSHLTTDAELDGCLAAFDACYRQLLPR